MVDVIDDLPRLGSGNDPVHEHSRPADTPCGIHKAAAIERAPLEISHKRIVVIIDDGHESLCKFNFQPGTSDYSVPRAQEPRVALVGRGPWRGQ